MFANQIEDERAKRQQRDWPISLARGQRFPIKSSFFAPIAGEGRLLLLLLFKNLVAASLLFLLRPARARLIDSSARASGEL